MDADENNRIGFQNSIRQRYRQSNLTLKCLFLFRLYRDRIIVALLQKCNFSNLTSWEMYFCLESVSRRYPAIRPAAAALSRSRLMFATVRATAGLEILHQRFADNIPTPGFFRRIPNLFKAEGGSRKNDEQHMR